MFSHVTKLWIEAEAVHRERYHLSGCSEKSRKPVRRNTDVRSFRPGRCSQEEGPRNSYISSKVFKGPN